MSRKDDSEIPDPVRPWWAQYDPHVLYSLDYPDVTINDLLTNAIEKYPQDVFYSFPRKQSDVCAGRCFSGSIDPESACTWA